LKNIRSNILRWYSQNARSLPWRRTRNPYRIVLSEVMLQQTQVSRVLEIYPKFLQRFPDFRSLARARTSTVIREWRGMGYNNRAVRLQRLAKEIVKMGKVPTDVRLLETLPGIGPYTARAVACFAFQKNVAVVDTNIKRVLTRLFPRDVKTRGEWSVAETLLPEGRAYSWNQALMELGATICLARSPRCLICPAARFCPSAFKPVPIQNRVSKQEPGRNGIPNRIYRGRIIEMLRNSRQPFTATQIGHHISTDFRPKDSSWLKRILKGLERDGLVLLKNGTRELTVSLP
jgi:A/G-specific adenine glycosylase